LKNLFHSLVAYHNFTTILAEVVLSSDGLIFKTNV